MLQIISNLLPVLGHIPGTHCQVVILNRFGIEISPGVNQQEMAIAVGRPLFLRNRQLPKLPFENLVGTLGRIVSMDLKDKLELL